MDIQAPPPCIGDYSVVELKQIIDPVTKRPMLAAEAPRTINTEDIKIQYRLPGLFIVGWRELHYEPYYDNLGAVRYKDRCIGYEHGENVARICAIRDYWNASDKKDPLLPSPVTPPTTTSLEMDMASQGWSFQYAPGAGPVYSIAVDKAVHWTKPETSHYFGYEEGADISPPVENVPVQPPMAVTPIVQQAAMQPVENALELKIDKLTDTVSQLLGVLSNAFNNNTGSSELRTSNNSGSTDNVVQQQQCIAEPGATSDQPSEPEDPAEGVSLLAGIPREHHYDYRESDVRRDTPDDELLPDLKNVLYPKSDKRFPVPK